MVFRGTWNGWTRAEGPCAVAVSLPLQLSVHMESSDHTSGSPLPSLHPVKSFHDMDIYTCWLLNFS